MQTFHVRLDNAEYNIHFAPGLLSKVGELMRASGLAGKAVMITNPAVAALHGQKVVASLREAGYETSVVEMPDGEEQKNLSTVASLYDSCLTSRVEREDAIVALGGGVVGDTAGFVAATYLRGLPFVQVPTTLLAQVDASIGGKVAVDHPRAKNVIGAFYQPRLVISDPQALDTLAPEEYRSGLAEVLKAGVIRSARLFTHLEEQGAEPLALIVSLAIAVKVEVVAADPYERGLRAILNFGHTIGHGIEAASNYAVRHGEAVSVGMMAATGMAVELGLCGLDVEQRLSRVLQRFELPTTVSGVTPSDVWQAMGADKKKRNGKLRFVLPRAIGDVIVTDEVPQEVAQRAIARVTGMGLDRDVSIPIWTARSKPLQLLPSETLELGDEDE